MRSPLRLAIGAAIAVFFSWLILRSVEPHAITHALASANLAWLFGASMALVVGYACRVERWRLMLARANHTLGWVDCAGPMLASFAANNVLPFRAGDVMRAFAFTHKLGAPPGTVLATVFVERLLDLLIILCMLGAALAFFGMDAASSAGMSGIALLMLGGVVLMVLLYPRLMSPIGHALGKYLTRLSPSIGKKVATEIENSLATLSDLASGGCMIGLVLWSAAVWLAEGCVFWMTALSFASILEPLAGWLVLPVATLATLVPSTPGYVGTFDYFAVRAMAAVGNGVTEATAYALLVHASIWLLPTVTGGVYLLFRPIRMHDRKALAS